MAKLIVKNKKLMVDAMVKTFKSIPVTGLVNAIENGQEEKVRAIVIKISKDPRKTTHPACT